MTGERRGGFSWTPHTDWMQKVLLALCLFDLTFFCNYMIRYAISKESTISESLFSDVGYRVVLSVLLSLRLLAGAMFLFRFRFKHKFWEISGYFWLCLTFAGWVWLVMHKDNTRHFIGVGLFCLGSFAYSFAFVRLARTGDDKMELLHANMEGFLLLAVVALVISFVTLWVEEENDGRHSGAEGVGAQHAYIVEHAAYVVHLLFYSFFFLYHSPDTHKVPGRYVVGGEYYHDDSFAPSETSSSMQDHQHGMIPMVCRPLMATSVTTTTSAAIMIQS